MFFLTFSSVSNVDGFGTFRFKRRDYSRSCKAIAETKRSHQLDKVQKLQIG